MSPDVEAFVRVVLIVGGVIALLAILAWPEPPSPPRGKRAST